MTTRPDYMSIESMDTEFAPSNKGFITAEEKDLITKELELEMRTDIELQNVRDMLVMYYHVRMKEARNGGYLEYYDELQDKMSGGAFAIDSERFKRGLEA